MERFGGGHGGHGGRCGIRLTGSESPAAPPAVTGRATAAPRAAGWPGIVVVVSVDTEEDHWEPTRDEVTVANIEELPAFQARCERLGARPSYFVTFPVAATARAADILRALAAGGRAEIAAHLHPWNTPPLDESFVPRNTMMNNLPASLQHAKVAALTRAIEAAVAGRPLSFRAGRCGLGRETTAALVDNGYRVDSSVMPWMSLTDLDDGPSFIGAPLTPYRLDGTTDPRVPVPGGPLVEFPLSGGFTRWPFRRWGRVHAALTRTWLRRLRLAGIASRLHLLRRVMLNPEISSPGDMLRLAGHLVAHGVKHLHLTLHSPSLVPGLSPFARSRRDVERLLGSLEAFVADLDRFAPVAFATVAEAAGVAPAPGRASAAAAG